MIGREKTGVSYGRPHGWRTILLLMPLSRRYFPAGDAMPVTHSNVYYQKMLAPQSPSKAGCLLRTQHVAPGGV
jgi:hypothetical protein